jgi:uncharacterized protein (TIGR00295 family)
VKASREEALRIHRKHGSNEAIVRHCQAVAEVSMLIVDRLEEIGTPVDRDAVLMGALLHDIGRTRVQTVRHGLEGSMILQEEGLDDKVAEIVRRHVGAGISADEARALGLPDLEYIPETIEQAVVCFSDKMVDGAQVRPFQEEVDRFKRKGHDVERLLRLKARLESELGEDPETLIFSKIKAR